MSGYSIRVFLFSGRPDPEWQVDETSGQKLEKLWNEFEPYSGDLPLAPPLGYRGCSLRYGSDVEYISFGGYVTRNAGGQSASRQDVCKRFEGLLLSTAPDDLVPGDLVGL